VSSFPANRLDPAVFWPICRGDRTPFAASVERAQAEETQREKSEKGALKTESPRTILREHMLDGPAALSGRVRSVQGGAGRGVLRFWEGWCRPWVEGRWAAAIPLGAKVAGRREGEARKRIGRHALPPPADRGHAVKLDCAGPRRLATTERR
jgi:hypothetical protein